MLEQNLFSVFSKLGKNASADVEIMVTVCPTWIQANIKLSSALSEGGP